MGGGGLADNNQKTSVLHLKTLRVLTGNSSLRIRKRHHHVRNKNSGNLLRAVMGTTNITQSCSIRNVKRTCIGVLACEKYSNEAAFARLWDSVRRKDLWNK
jgi:hypothetical protein